MKKILLFFFGCVMVAAFCSCEQKGVVENPPEPAVVEVTEGVEDSTTVQPSPIKGVWQYAVEGMQMTFNFGDKEVEYKCHTDLYNATGIYTGTYTIKDKDITLAFKSLSSKSAHVDFYAPEDMPKNAVLKDEDTIEYIDKEYIRKKE